MPVDWYYVQQGQRNGPLPEPQIKELLRAGSIAPNDLVWNSTMANWVPAHTVEPILFGSGSSGHAVADGSLSVAASSPPSSLGYESPAESGPVLATAYCIDLLRQTRPWVLMLGILFFIGAGFMLLASVVMMGFGMMAALRGGASGLGRGAGFALGAIYFVMAALYIYPALCLTRYSSRIATLVRMRRSTDLEAALAAQKSFWKFTGIAIVVVFALYLIALFGMLAIRMR